MLKAIIFFGETTTVLGADLTFNKGKQVLKILSQPFLLNAVRMLEGIFLTAQDVRSVIFLDTGIKIKMLINTQQGDHGNFRNANASYFCI